MTRKNKKTRRKNKHQKKKALLSRPSGKFKALSFFSVFLHSFKHIRLKEKKKTEDKLGKIKFHKKRMRKKLELLDVFFLSLEVSVSLSKK